MAQNYVKEFNSITQKYFNNKTALNEANLTKNLTLLRTSIAFEHLNPRSTEACEFFSNLLNLMVKIDVGQKSGLLWSAVCVVERALQSQTARTELIDSYRILPVLSDVLSQITAEPEEKIIRLLTLIQDYTYGITITWEEPYLQTLIKILVHNILEESEALALISLSVLVNLCYKNKPCVYLLLHCCPLSDFIHKIKSNGMLTVKMYIILENSTLTSDIHHFLQLSFNELEGSLCTWNVPYIRHIVSFIVDLKNAESTYDALVDYKNFNAKIPKLISTINDRMSMEDDSSMDEDDQGNQQQCMAMVFELLTCLLSVDPSLSTNYSTIADLASKWVDTKAAGAKATDLLSEIFTRCSKNPPMDALVTINDFDKILKTQCQRVESETVDSERVKALLKLIAVACQTENGCKCVSAIVQKSFFDTLLGRLLTLETEKKGEFYNMSVDEMEVYLYCLNAIIELSKVVPKDWYATVVSLFKLKPMHCVIANGLISDKEEIRSLVLVFSKINEFPSNEISKILGTLLSSKAKNPPSTPPQYAHNPPTFISKDQRERIDDVINNLSDALTKNRIDDVATSEIIELYTFKLKTYEQNEADFQQRLQVATHEITNLSRRVAFLKCEIQKHQSMHFSLQLANQKSKGVIATLEKDSAIYRQSLNDFQNKLSKEVKRHEPCEKIILDKVNEIEMLRSDGERLRMSVNKLGAEVAQFKTEAAEIQKRNEEFRKYVKTLEDSSKQSQKMIDEKKADVQTLNRKLYDMGKEMSELAAELVKKDEKIQQCENEIKESNYLQNAIVNMVQKKGKK